MPFFGRIRILALLTFLGRAREVAVEDDIGVGFCENLPFHCEPPGGSAPVPCQPATHHNWPALREFVTVHSHAEIAEILEDSPALQHAVYSATVDSPGYLLCEREESNWLREKLTLIGSSIQDDGTYTSRSHNGRSKRRRFVSMPLGSVVPKGWIKDTLEQSGNGLAGRLFEFYPPVMDSNFIGGSSSYSSLLEDFPYALNGLVPLAATTADYRLVRLCDEAVARVLSTQNADGWLGPDEWPENEPDDSSLSALRATMLSSSIWARYPLLQGLVQYIEWRGVFDMHSDGLACRAFSAVVRFVIALARRLDSGRCTLVAWSAARWTELVMTLNWLYEHPTGGVARCSAEISPDLLRRRLRSLAWLARLLGYDWERWFGNSTFPTTALNRSNFSLYSHGVNNAVAVKWGAVWGAIFGSPKKKVKSTHAWKQLQDHHGVISGAFAADEHLAGLESHRGTELCIVVDSIRSLAETYAANPSAVNIADSIEKLAFNALPSAVSDDHWSHQYLTQSNTLLAGIERVGAATIEGDANVGNEKHTDDQASLSKHFGNVGLDATAYGVSPNFPCCTVNFIQGWPKLLAYSSWFWEGEEPLLLSGVFLPSILQIPKPVGGSAELITKYPFTDDAHLTYVFRNLAQSLSVLVRVPVWADVSASFVRGPLGVWHASDMLERDGFRDVGNKRPIEVLHLKVAPGDSSWEVVFVARWRFVAAMPSSTKALTFGSFMFGPLIFVLPIDYFASQLPVDDGPYGPGKHPPSEVRDEELVAKDFDSWAQLVLLDDLEHINISMQLQIDEEHSAFGFSSNPSKCVISARVLGMFWPEWRALARGSEALHVVPKPPLLAPSDLNSRPVSEVTLRPFGCTKLRIGLLPVLDMAAHRRNFN
eukprot:TRINITY_DN19834_c0_g2_i1.p1 TRINITY_DN19834_c0_g2~~TRINITY_DN19834_c0_g2_i1.p1  ORF type:complete len:909 (+),score=48.65 TRINITY_DN19834_c0_g2_i1:91-2727(+)